jgi:hypothetical protein
MDPLNIFNRIEEDDFEFILSDIDKIETFTIITQGNPGCVTVMLEIYKNELPNKILTFLNKIWKQQIIGARLWYIYKNEFNHNIEDLLSKDLSQFTAEYFKERFEKYI